MKRKTRWKFDRYGTVILGELLSKDFIEWSVTYDYITRNFRMYYSIDYNNKEIVKINTIEINGK